MSAKASPSEKLGKELAAGIRDGDVVGLGSGSTVARLLPAMVKDMRDRGVEAQWVPTSLQIPAGGARAAPQDRAPHDAGRRQGGGRRGPGRREAEQIEGGGGALLKEKVLLSSAKRAAIVADEKKFAEKLSARRPHLNPRPAPSGPRRR